MSAIDLFAGPGGWDISARQLGIVVLGIERDPSACSTRRAAGLATIEEDVLQYGPEDFPGVGLIASPPCQTFSSAGKGSGRAALDSVVEAAGHLAARNGLLAHMIADTDERTALVLEPLRWALDAHDAGTPYEWVVLEQVPPVLPVWEAFAGHLQALGYSVATGVLSSEQYGVPQTRRRAILVARFDGAVALPAPTHSRYYPRNPDRLDPGVLPWVSMAEALGWDEGVAVRSNYGTRGDPADRRVRIGSRPAWTVTSKVDRNIIYRNGNQANSARRGIDTPAPTIHFGARMNSVEWVGDVKPTRVTVQEAATLQSFPPDYPWQGTKTAQYQQVGNAIPPLLALRVLEQATGLHANEKAA